MAASRRSQLVVGEVGRPHGLRGGVVVRLSSTEVDRMTPGSVLSTDRGELVVTSARPQKDRFVVTFEGIESVEAAGSLRGLVLRAAPVDRPGALWVDELIGVVVVDTSGTELGTIEAIEDNPASDLLVLGGGVLIPARFAVGDVVDGVLVVDVPEGLV